MSRVRIFSVVLGFILALAGIVLDNRPLIWAAMVVLSVTLALRYWSRGREVQRPND